MADRREDETRPLSERVSAAVPGSAPSLQSSRGADAGMSTRGASASTGGGPTSSSTVSSGTSPVRAAATRPKGTRRARLRLVHLDPWSVMKTSFLLSIAFGIVTVVAVAVVWSVLGAAGVWESINESVKNVIGGEEAKDFDVENYVGMSRVLGFTMLVSVIDVVLITAIATLGAFLYNMSAALLGGIEVTLAEDDR